MDRKTKPDQNCSPSASLMTKLEKIMKVSVPKTLRFNLHYFGFRRALKFPVVIGKNITLVELGGQVQMNPDANERVRIGISNVGIFDEKYDKGIWQNRGDIVFKGGASFGIGTKISNGGTLTFGANFASTAKTEFVCHDQVTIGDDCLLSWDTLIMDKDSHKVLDMQGNTLNKQLPVLIGDHVWIGCRCCILKGAVIGSNSIVAAQSIVTKKIEKDHALIGETNRILRENINWEK